jgi:phage-related protein
MKPLAARPVSFMGSSLDDLRRFPTSARREAGFQLDSLQHGRQPADWKPMPAVGSGVEEIRIRDDAGAFRVLYVARFAEAVYVLHVFQKKTRATAGRDIALARTRYRQVLEGRKPK